MQQTNEISAASMGNTVKTPGSPGLAEQSCPVCGATIPVDTHYVTWCDNCGWNLQPQTPLEPDNIFDVAHASIGKRASRHLFDSMLRAEKFKPSLSRSALLAFGVAIMVHGLTLAFAILAVFLLVRGWPHPAAVFWGLVCGGIAWVLRPRVLEMPQDIVPREQMPTLYRMTSEIARKLDGPLVDAIVVDEKFNAAFGQAGWRGKRVLYLGLPLLAILDDQEKLALIGHELAHSVNGDPRRGFFVGTAVRSLVEWYAILHPGDVFDTHGEPLGFLMIPFNLVMLGLAKIVWLAAYALSQLLWRNSQRAEYLADYLATHVSGTDAMLAMLRKLHLGRTFTLVVQNIGLSRRQQSLLDELRHRVRTVPPRELERIRRVEQLELSRLDASHPPTAYRLAYLEAHRVEQPQPLFSASDFEKLEQELAPFEGRIQKKLLDQHAESLYYR